jgi:hypothetical protein
LFLSLSLALRLSLPREGQREKPSANAVGSRRRSVRR